MGSLTCEQFKLYTEDGITLVARIYWDGSKIIIDPESGINVAIKPYTRGLDGDGNPHREVIINGEVV